MDNQFTNLTKSFYDNFLEYRIGGSTGSQTAYTAADQGIKTILDGLRNRVNVQNQEITNFYNSDVEGKLKNIRSEIEATQQTLVTNKDKVVTAQMRTPEVMPQASSTSVPIGYWIGIGVLITIAALLMVV